MILIEGVYLFYRHWATSGRSLITRDVQKITEIFTIRFGQFVNEKLEDELRKHAISTKNIAGEFNMPIKIFS